MNTYLGHQTKEGSTLTSYIQHGISWNRAGPACVHPQRDWKGWARRSLFPRNFPPVETSSLSAAWLPGFFSAGSASSAFRKRFHSFHCAQKALHLL